MSLMGPARHHVWEPKGPLVTPPFCAMVTCPITFSTSTEAWWD
jgi:hypothetical protein